MEIKKIAKIVDEEFKKYFKNDKTIKSIFVVGSMTFDDYQERADNDYDIRAVSTKVTARQIQDFEKFLSKLSKKLTTKDIGVNYSCLVGPVNHNVSTKDKNFLIHAMIHQESQLDDFLPVTHKYSYSKRHRIVEGEDCIDRFKDIRYTIDDILNAHEGLNYCIDMLEKREYRYLTWEIDGTKCEFVFKQDKMPEDTIYENCFYSTNKFLKNLRNYCNWNEIEMPENYVEAAMDLLGEKYQNEKTREIIQCLVAKDEEKMKILTKNPIETTIPILQELGNNVKTIEKFYKKKVKENERILQKTN